MYQSEKLLSENVFDRTLRDNVHPTSWENPKAQSRYHLVVVGAGTAGLVTAAGAAALGARVALVERELMGGDCLNVGCVPSKALLRAARAFADVQNAGDFGVRNIEDAQMEFSAAMDRMRRLRAGLSPVDSAERFRSLGVDVFFGEGRFSGPKSLRVGRQELRFRRAVIATGARAAALPIPGLSEAGYLNNESVFNLESLPPTLAVIGAGPIGCELAQAFRRFGSNVYLLEVAPQILIREDPDAAALIQESLNRDGVKIIAECDIQRVETRGDQKVLLFEHRGETQELLVEQILLGVGRAPNVEGLDLEAAKVRYDDRTGVLVNDMLRTSNKAIYAAGDICSRFQFTHAADAMARIVIQNALFPGRAKVSALTMPWCTYTDPEIAHLGLHKKEAQAKGLRVDTYLQTLSDVDRAVLDGETDGFVKIHVRRGSDRILGATIVARHAGEMISGLSLAMTHGLGLGALSKTIHPYPTQAEAVRKVADAYHRTRLTPFTRFLLKLWFGLQR